MGWPARTVAASRSGTSPRKRKGFTRTTVTTGAAAPRYSPTEARFSCTMPSKGATTMVSASACRASESSVRRCASSAWRLRISSTAS
jgi:hypothetical protein